MTEPEEKEETVNAAATGTAGARVHREATVRIALDDGSQVTDILLTDEQARQVYSQLRRWYGRNK